MAASLVFSYILVAIGVFMTSWGFLGLIEFIWGYAAVIPLQNAGFPRGTQMLHWVLISASGLVFLVGYFSHWPFTPLAMLVIYSMMAGLCFVQTIDFMTNPGRYIAMISEYVAYIAICLYLFQSHRMQVHFGEG